MSSNKKIKLESNSATNDISAVMASKETSFPVIPARVLGVRAARAASPEAHQTCLYYEKAQRKRLDCNFLHEVDASDCTYPGLAQLSEHSSTGAHAPELPRGEPRAISPQSSSSTTGTGPGALTRGQQKLAERRKQTGHLPCHSLQNKGTCVRGKTCGFSHDIVPRLREESPAP